MVLLPTLQQPLFTAPRVPEEPGAEEPASPEESSGLSLLHQESKRRAMLATVYWSRSYRPWHRVCTWSRNRWAARPGPPAGRALTGLLLKASPRPSAPHPTAPCTLPPASPPAQARILADDLLCLLRVPIWGGIMWNSYCAASGRTSTLPTAGSWPRSCRSCKGSFGPRASGPRFCKDRSSPSQMR